jgi:hypothetical protein
LKENHLATIVSITKGARIVVLKVRICATTQPRKAVKHMRDRLKMMIAEANVEWLNKTYDYETDKTLAEYTTDILLANGVIVLPCKVGDKVYQINPTPYGGEIYELEVFDVSLHKNKPYFETETIDFDTDAIGKSVFLIREEAEQALKGGEGK